MTPDKDLFAVKFNLAMTTTERGDWGDRILEEALEVYKELPKAVRPAAAQEVLEVLKAHRGR